MAARDPVQPEGPAPGRASARADDGAGPAGSATGLRLYRRGSEMFPRADGGAGPRSDRLDGHGYAAGGALGPAAASLRLFQAEFRAGYQPADRSDPRGSGHVARLDDRAQAEPARS